MIAGLALLLVGALALVLGFAGARYAALRALGIRDRRLAMGTAPSWAHPDAPRYARAAVIVAGVLGAYAVSSAFATMSVLGTGVTSLDEASMRVSVAKGGPADAAGVVDGDRIVSVDGRNVLTWDELRAAVKAHAHDEVRLVIERGGQTRTLSVALPSDGPRAGKLQVGPHATLHRAGLGEALGGGIALPAVVVYESARGFLRMFAGQEKAEFSGPSGIVRATSNRAAVSGIWAGLELVAALMAYGLFVVAIVSVVVTPRRKRAA